MRVTLIKPNIGRREHSLYVDEGRMEPLQLGVLAGLTPEHIDLKLYDDRMEKIPYDESTDLVAITVETYTARRSYEIAQEYRDRGVPVIMGGMHVTLIPEEVAEHADSIFIGDAETVWHQVLEDAENKKLKKIYKAPPGVAQIGRIFPRRDLFKEKGYLPMSLMQFTRVCKFACHFCAVSQYFEKKHYIRMIDDVLEEISTRDRSAIFFVDDNIATDKNALKDLCRALIPLKVNWWSQASLDITHDPELMQLLADSGCFGFVMGFESITQDSLKEAKKSPNLPGFSNFEHEIKTLRDYGLQTWAAFTLGYDHDTKESIQATYGFAMKNKFAFSAFNILMPYPNTPFYQKLEKENRLLYDKKWWLHEEYQFNHASFIPKNMTPDELTKVCFKIRADYNKISSIIYRFSDIKTNLKNLARAGYFIYYNKIFRKEVFKKQGMYFGLKHKNL